MTAVLAIALFLTQVPPGRALTGTVIKSDFVAGGQNPVTHPGWGAQFVYWDTYLGPTGSVHVDVAICSLPDLASPVPVCGFGYSGEPGGFITTDLVLNTWIPRLGGSVVHVVPTSGTRSSTCGDYRQTQEVTGLDVGTATFAGGDHFGPWDLVPGGCDAFGRAVGATPATMTVAGLV